MGTCSRKPIHFNEFRTYISGKRKNKAPGMSGVRMDHICGLHEQGQKDINLLLSITYISEMTFSAWHKEIINWIPKEPGNPAMDRRRPICLLEVMRKIALGIKSRKVFDIWEEAGVIDKDNYAFTKGNTTTDPILIKKMILEDAIRNNKPLYTVDIDYKAAYDRVPYFMKEMCLRRMGMPEKGIKLWCKHDVLRTQFVRTAYGFSEEGVHPQAGAFGQGAVESPMGFVSLMSWKCDYIELECSEKDPYEYEWSAQHEKLVKSIFCEDASYYSKSFDGAQALTDAVGMFGAASGMELNVKKSFWSKLNDDKNKRKLTIIMPKLNTEVRSKSGEWKFKFERKVVAEKRNEEAWRHLGNFQNNFNAPDETIAQIKLDIEGGLEFMCKRNVSPEGALRAFNAKCIPKMMYKLKHNNLAENQLGNVQRKVGIKLKPKMNIHKTVPGLLLYGSRYGGGLELPHMWDVVNMEKNIILQDVLTKTNKSMYAIMCGAIHRLQTWNGLSPEYLQSKKIKLIEQDLSAWLSSVWSWNASNDVSIKLPDIKACEKIHHRDFFIMDKYIDAVILDFDDDEKSAWEDWNENEDYGLQTVVPRKLKIAASKINQMATTLRKGGAQRFSDLFESNVGEMEGSHGAIHESDDEEGYMSGDQATAGTMDVVEDDGKAEYVPEEGWDDNRSSESDSEDGWESSESMCDDNSPIEELADTRVDALLPQKRDKTPDVDLVRMKLKWSRNRVNIALIKELQKMGVVKSEELNEMEELLIPRMNHIPSTPKNPLIRMEETGILNMISGVSISNDLADLIEEEEELEFYTDGSLKRNARGAIGWICTTRDSENEDEQPKVLLKGGGRESEFQEDIVEMNSHKVVKTVAPSSTRPILESEKVGL